MPDRFTLLTFSFCFILHNVCSWSVSEPLNHTFNDDDSVSVTCEFMGEEEFQLEAKLKMNDKYVCEVYNKNQVQDKHKHDCEWQHKDNKFTFTLMKPEGLHKNIFSCEMSRIKPFPVKTKEGPKTKLFRGCNKSLSPSNSCPSTNQTNNQDRTPVEIRTPEEMYTLLICGLIIVVAMLSVYSIILTAVYIRLRRIHWRTNNVMLNFSKSVLMKNKLIYNLAGLRITKHESSDTLTYVPMQRNVNRYDVDNTEYVDMREVQKRGGSHRDMNHNSHLAIA